MFTKKITRRTFLHMAVAGAAAFSGVRASFAKSLLPESGALTLFNAHTNDRLSVNFRRADGSYDLDALNAVNWIMRCRYTDQITIMDVNAIEYLNLVDKKLGEETRFTSSPATALLPSIRFWCKTAGM